MPGSVLARRSSTTMARMKKRTMVREPPKPKLRKRKQPWARKNTVLKHIPGTLGIMTKLADNLGCSLITISIWLNKPGWEHVKEAMLGEKRRALEQIRANVFTLAQFSMDDGTRFNASKFLLERLDDDFNPKSTTVVQGGDKAIQHDHHISGAVVMVPADVLNMALEDQVQILEAGEAREKELIKEAEVEAVS